MSNLTEAASLLEQHYGRRPAPETTDLWQRCVHLIVGHGRAAKAQDWIWLDETPLASVVETSRVKPAVLASVLESHKQPPKAAGTLVAVAKWWCRIVGNSAAAQAENPFADLSLETLREQLQAMPGVNMELADRLLLAGGRLAIPLDRGTLRVVCRHGWLDWQSDYEEWQSLFRRDWTEAEALAQTSWWFSRVAKEFCKPVPHCEGCPLQPLLPANGPVELLD